MPSIARTLPLLAVALGASALDAQRDDARHAQRDFEAFRRARLPEAIGGRAPCEERFGRYCYWDNNGEVPPKEPGEIAARRRVLLDQLAAAAGRAPGDDWVHGQLVRYLVEERMHAEAATAARSCGGTAWWCHALLGWALHEGSDHAGAATAFDAALESMPAPMRCQWTDVSPWMDEDVGDYRRLGCGAARDSASRRFLWLSRPLWMLPGDDARAELLSRRVMSRILAQTAHAYREPWGDDIEALTLRYAWPVAWSRRRESMTAETTVGHEPAPSWDVTPSPRAARRPLEAGENDWAPKRPRPKMRYAPRYARRDGAFAPLAHQLAWFRRGDSALVALAWDLGADTNWARGDVRVGFVLTTSPARELATMVRENAPRAGVLLRRVPLEPALVSVEAWSPRRSYAARSRYAVHPPGRDARLSSLAVLRRPPPDTALSVEEVMLAALGTRDVRSGEAIHLYWETYGEPTPGDPDLVSLSMARVGVGLLGRAAQRVRLAPRARPVAMRWSDAGRPRGGHGRSLALRIPELPPGTYRIDLALGADVPGARATTSATVRVLPARGAARAAASRQARR